MIDIADKLNNTAFSGIASGLNKGIASGLNKINESNKYVGMALNSLQAAQTTKQHNIDILNNMESNIYYKKSLVPSGIVVFGENTAYGTTEQSKAYLKTNKLKYRGSIYDKE